MIFSKLDESLLNQLKGSLKLQRWVFRGLGVEVFGCLGLMTFGKVIRVTGEGAPKWTKFFVV